MMNENALRVRAEKVLVGGVTSAWNNFEIFGAKHFSGATGAHIKDIDGKEYIDYCMGWGSLFMGHQPQFIREAFDHAFNIGFGFQYETEYSIKLAELIIEIVPCAEKVRFANSGTEATQFAIRMARSITGREKIIKFEGHFHGVHDYLLYSMDTSSRLGKKLESGAFESIPGSSGIPGFIKDVTITLPYNDINALEQVLEYYKGEIAGIIMEPICLASAVILPDKEFINFIREACNQFGILLIFDEVMSGFRENIGGAQKTLDVIPDIATFGKVLGCGMSIAAIAGKTQYMDVLAPIGPSVASGTNTGRLLTMMGSYYALSYLKNHQECYEKLRKLSKRFDDSATEILTRNGIKGVIQSYGGRTVIHFGTDNPIHNFRDTVTTWDKKFHLKCYEKTMANGLYAFLLPLLVCPEPLCITPSHTFEDIDQTLNIFEDIIKQSK